MCEGFSHSLRKSRSGKRSPDDIRRYIVLVQPLVADHVLRVRDAVWLDLALVVVDVAIACRVARVTQQRLSVELGGIARPVSVEIAREGRRVAEIFTVVEVRGRLL